MTPDMTMETTPRRLSGIFPFEGTGLREATLLDPALDYTVPSDKRAQLIYLRLGNSADGLACLSLMRDGQVMRLFPVGARGAIHVSLAVVEDIFPDTRLEAFVAAPPGVAGELVVDIGLIEI
jgi:hypothetical protein